MSVITVELYPTPEAVVIKMVADLDIDLLWKWHILDPSAGDGSMLQHLEKYINRRLRWNYKARQNMAAIEISPELRAVLNDKNIRVIDTDFLEYEGLYYHDFYIMNPPFSEGARHLLHAWDISGGALIKCLLNVETISNPCTAERQRLAKIIEQHGTVESFGQCFKDADRPTSVGVVCVTLQNKAVKNEAFRLEYDPVAKARVDFDQDFSENPLASRDIFESYESQFKAVLAAMQELLVAKRKVEYYAQGLEPTYTSHTISKLIAAAAESRAYDQAYNQFITDLTANAWQVLFAKTKLNAMTTSEVSRQISQLEANQGQMAFTAKNMEEVFYTLALSQGGIMLACVEEAFDYLTKYHATNREALEGFKTNAAYKVSQKFILPYMTSDRKNPEWASLNRYHELNDLDKAMCFVSGQKFEEITTIYQAVEGRQRYNSGRRNSLPFGDKIFSTFFEFVIYKKGTMHFKFLDEFVRAEFNRLVAEHRKWLPEKAKRGVFN